MKNQCRSHQVAAVCLSETGELDRLPIFIPQYLSKRL